MRKSTIFIIYTFAGFLAMGLIFVHASYRKTASAEINKEMADTVRTLGLTDLCIFTEARYTRHPSVTDLHSAFQDHPVSLEHFPSGSLIGPPLHLGK
jgi:hypothetical protein